MTTGNVTSHYLRYSAYRYFRLQVRLTLAFFGVVAVLLDVAALAGYRGSPPLTRAEFPPFNLIVYTGTLAAFFTLVVLWLTYWFGFRIAYWLEARDGRLVCARGFARARSRFRRSLLLAPPRGCQGWG